MEYLVQVIGSGILQGIIYALIAVSLVLIYKTSEVFNFSIGEFCTIGAVFFFILQSLGLPLWAIIPGFLIMSAFQEGMGRLNCLQDCERVLTSGQQVEKENRKRDHCRQNL